jgi:hypothetical protein
MNDPIPINLAVEDSLTESLTLKILRHTSYVPKTIYNRGGCGYLKRNINGFNKAARGTPFLVGTDLDQYECPPVLIADWLRTPKHPNLLIRVAVREAEAWVLADTEGFAKFLGIRAALIPTDVEALPNPKGTLLALARSSNRKNLRTDLCPPTGTTNRIGPNYNGQLARFVGEIWNPDKAKLNSRSLKRTLDRLASFRPTWANPA